MSSIAEKFVEAKQTALYTLFFLIIITITKIVVSIFSGSIALLADGFHSFSDVIIVAIALFVVSMLAREPSERFPYGYYKLEDFATLVISAIFFLVAINLALEAVNRILYGYLLQTNVSLASLTAFCCAVFSFFIAHRQEKIAMKYGITSLQLNAKEMKYDAVSSILVGVSVILAPYLLLPLEEIVAVIISLLIIRISVSAIRDSILNLLDAWNQPEIIAKMREIIMSFRGVKNVKSIRIRRAGPLIFGDAVIGVAAEQSFENIHRLLDAIEFELRRRIPGLSDIIIHAEPVELKESTICIPVVRVNKDKFIVSEHFGRAPFVAIITVDKDNRTFRILSIEENPFATKPKHSGVKLSRIVGEKGVDAVIVKNIGEAAYLSLKAYMINIFRTDKSNLDDVINDFLSGNVEQLRAPTKEE